MSLASISLSQLKKDQEKLERLKKKAAGPAPLKISNDQKALAVDDGALRS